jgi:hypothetical protein
MVDIIHFLPTVCIVIGAIGLVTSLGGAESDGSKQIARVLRAVGFLFLALALKGYV